MAATAGLAGVFWLQRPPEGAAMELASYGEWGFGFYKMNLLAPFDSQGWSWLLPDLPSSKGEIEGYAFLGLGVLLLAVAAVLLVRRAWPAARIGREHVPLIVILLALALFAISPDVAIGAQRFYVSWPAPLLALGHLFRSSGRFAWPLVYCATIAICWVVAHGAGRRAASALLIAAALVQIADGSAGWRAYAGVFARHGATWPTPLRSAFWSQAGHRYRAIRRIAPRNYPPAFRDLAYWALTHRIPGDIVYLARYDAGALEHLTRRRGAELREGRLARDTLWITEGVPAGALARMPRGKGDFVGTIDGVPLYAPGFGRVRPLTSRIVRRGG
jgi:hypothetical protein